MAEAMENPVVVARTIRQVQQTFAETLGFGDEIIWDLLSEQQPEILRLKIDEIIRDPDANPDESQEKQAKRRTAVADMRETLFNSVWEQRKYTNRNSLASIIFVLVATEETDANRAESANRYSLHPVFRTRRCISRESGSNSNSSDCCMIFVDENGRVYQHWQSYVDDNELPAGIMVAPQRGIYKLCEGRVELDKYLSPAGSANRKFLGILDTSTAIGGFAAACVPIAALLTLPVAAPVMAAAAGVGLASAGYATARSAVQLVDRNQHEQSINVTDRKARGHWLGVLAGAVGLGAAGATSVMTAATQAGREVGAITQLTINGMNITSIVISGSGVANGMLDLILKYQDGDDVTAMDLLQLSASLVLFTHSVYNFRLASTIISETQNSTIARYRETLSNRQRQSFDKISKETIRIRGNTRDKIDIIRGVNDVPSKQQFNDLYKINKQLNQQEVRPAFAPDGQGVVLNDEVLVTNTQELRASVQHNVGADILGQVTQPIPETHSAATASARGTAVGGSRLLGPNPQALETPEPSNFATGVRVLQLSSIIVNGVLITLRDFGPVIFDHIVNAESFEMLILQMAERFEPDIFRFVLNLTDTFMATIKDELHTVLKFFISSESVLYRILKHILDKYEHPFSFEFIQDKTSEILRAVKVYFLSLNPNNYGDLLVKCKTCEGFYKICSL